MTEYTKTEAAAINAAWRAINEVCSRTNWSNGPTWKEAERLERRQCPDDMAQKSIGARAMICKGWLEGLEAPEIPASKLYWIRPGYLAALLLGVRHAIERRGDEYAGPSVESAAELCRAAIAANAARTSRIVEG